MSSPMDDREKEPTQDEKRVRMANQPPLLTDEERRRVALWCHFNARTCEGMAKQMESFASPPMMAIAKRERAKAAAYEIVAREIDEAETFTLGGSDVR